MFEFIFSLIAKLFAILFLVTIIILMVGFFRVMIKGRGNGSSNNPGNSSIWG